eukprot:5246042-Amphidinium_carterae.1
MVVEGNGDGHDDASFLKSLELLLHPLLRRYSLDHAASPCASELEGLASGRAAEPPGFAANILPKSTWDPQCSLNVKPLIAAFVEHA